MLDSNQRLHAYRACALAAMLIIRFAGNAARRRRQISSRLPAVTPGSIRSDNRQPACQAVSRRLLPVVDGKVGNSSGLTTGWEGAGFEPAKVDVHYQSEDWRLRPLGDPSNFSFIACSSF